MFGIAVAALSPLSDAEKERYQAIYCGLCRELKRRYGQISRAALSYDLAFLALLYASLYEPAEETGKMHCISHPRKQVPYAITPHTSYCADLSVALAYHKCLDDVADEGSPLAHVARAALERSYKRVARVIPYHCETIGYAMDTIRAIEADPHSPPDEASIAFGELLGFLFESCPACVGDVWAPNLQHFGYELGRFVYLMDAAVDFDHDQRYGTYNPFLKMAQAAGETKADPAMMRTILAVIAGQATDTFERLPLVQDVNLMRSVLYEGVWQKFNQEYRTRDTRISNTQRIAPSRRI